MLLSAGLGSDRLPAASGPHGDLQPPLWGLTRGRPQAVTAEGQARVPGATVPCGASF